MHELAIAESVVSSVLERTGFHFTHGTAQEAVAAAI